MIHKEPNSRLHLHRQVQDHYSYGRKFVETMARQSACEIAQRVMSSGEACRSSAFHFATCSKPSQAEPIRGCLRACRHHVSWHRHGEDRAVAKVAEAFSVGPFRGIALTTGARSFRASSMEMLGETSRFRRVPLWLAPR